MENGEKGQVEIYVLKNCQKTVKDVKRLKKIQNKTKRWKSLQKCENVKKCRKNGGNSPLVNLYEWENFWSVPFLSIIKRKFDLVNILE